jgi:hypothetical protein
MGRFIVIFLMRSLLYYHFKDYSQQGYGIVSHHNSHTIQFSPL